MNLFFSQNNSKVFVIKNLFEVLNGVQAKRFFFGYDKYNLLVYLRDDFTDKKSCNSEGRQPSEMTQLVYV